MKCGRGRAFAGALALLSISATALADPASPAPSAAPDSPAADQPAPAVALPPTGDESELPAHPPVYQSMQGGRAAGGPPIPADARQTSPPVPRGPYVHDGVFFRVSVGPGLFQGSSGTSPDFRSFTAGAVSIDAAVGGSPGRGFVLGAEFQTNRFFSLSSSDDIEDGDEPNLSDVSFSVSGLGMFADYYPEPTDGLHFLASIGIGWLDVSRSNNSSERNPSGVLMGLGGGYEWFVASNFSLGVLLRGNLGLFSVEEVSVNGSSTSVTVFIPSLLATATYN
jgi:hypothetical protein